MKKQSAGLLVYRMKEGKLEVLIAHQGGPFWAKKDVWTIPKGLYEQDEEPLVAARREFEEEIGQKSPNGRTIALGEITRKDGKTIKAWAIEGDIDVSKVKSNTFEIEWPPRSGKIQEFSEVDRAAWVDINSATAKMHTGQDVFIKRLAEKLGATFAPPKQNSLF
ncbi:MAG: NUDIX domain-containing protein [Candidatus Saccharimonadales bacterium]